MSKYLWNNAKVTIEYDVFEFDEGPDYCAFASVEIPHANYGYGEISFTVISTEAETFESFEEARADVLRQLPDRIEHSRYLTEKYDVPENEVIEDYDYEAGDR